MIGLIFDRTSADRIAVDEILQRYQSGDWSLVTSEEKEQLERGTYTYNTLNRVESAVRDLAAVLTSYGYNVKVSTKTNWGAQDYFNEENLQRYLENLDTLKNVFYTYATTPITPLLVDMFFIDAANSIEKILFDIEDLITKLSKGFRKMGTFSMGGRYL